MTTPDPETPELPAGESFLQDEIETKKREAERQQRTIVITAVIFLVLLIAGIVAAVIGLLQPNTPTDKIRDIFIIFMALESLLIGAALIVLIVQFASLINLLQNEVRPILDSTNETVNHLRGTAEFLGENVVEPVVKLNGYLAGLQRMLELLGVKKK
jgi:ABC-type dipeptide/oligopeptide/nickel transport system permease component